MDGALAAEGESIWADTARGAFRRPGAVSRRIFRIQKKRRTVERGLPVTNGGEFDGSGTSHSRQRGFPFDTSATIVPLGAAAASRIGAIQALVFAG